MQDTRPDPTDEPDPEPGKSVKITRQDRENPTISSITKIAKMDA